MRLTFKKKFKPSIRLPKAQEHIRATRRTRAVRSLVKTITYRLISFIFTGALAWLLFGSLTAAGAFAFIDFFMASALYYGHERLWAWIDLRPKGKPE